MQPTSPKKGMTQYTQFDSNAENNNTCGGDVIQAIKLLETAKGETTLTNNFKAMVNNAMFKCPLFLSLTYDQKKFISEFNESNYTVEAKTKLFNCLDGLMDGYNIGSFLVEGGSDNKTLGELLSSCNENVKTNYKFMQQSIINDFSNACLQGNLSNFEVLNEGEINAGMILSILDSINNSQSNDKSKICAKLLGLLLGKCLDSRNLKDNVTGLTLLKWLKKNEPKVNVGKVAIKLFAAAKGNDLEQTDLQQLLTASIKNKLLNEEEGSLVKEGRNNSLSNDNVISQTIINNAKMVDGSLNDNTNYSKYKVAIKSILNKLKLCEIFNQQQYLEYLDKLDQSSGFTDDRTLNNLPLLAQQFKLLSPAEVDEINQLKKSENKQLASNDNTRNNDTNATNGATKIYQEILDQFKQYGDFSWINDYLELGLKSEAIEQSFYGVLHAQINSQSMSIVAKKQLIRQYLNILLSKGIIANEKFNELDKKL